MSMVEAILSLRPNAEFSMTNRDDYSTIVWHTKKITAPTAGEVFAEIERLEEKAKAEKVAAEAKLAKLGLTVDDLKALLS